MQISNLNLQIFQNQKFKVCMDMHSELSCSYSKETISKYINCCSLDTFWSAFFDKTEVITCAAMPIFINTDPMGLFLCPWVKNNHQKDKIQRSWEH